MTKRVRSDCRPYDLRPVSLIPLGQVKSQDALDNLSRYEEVSRQFAQEFPQLAWNLERHSWIPWFLSPNTGRQENRTTALADETIATDSLANPIRGLVYDSEFATSASYSNSMYSDDGYFDALPFATTAATTAATTSPAERLSNPDSLTPPDSDADFDPSCDIEALTSQLLWNNEIQEPRYSHALQNRNEEHIGKQWDGPCPEISESLITQPAEQRESSYFNNKAPAEASYVDRDKMNQTINDLNQLGNRLREDARRQLDVISGDVCL